MSHNWMTESQTHLDTGMNPLGRQGRLIPGARMASLPFIEVGCPWLHPTTSIQAAKALACSTVVLHFACQVRAVNLASSWSRTSHGPQNEECMH